MITLYIAVITMGAYILHRDTCFFNNHDPQIQKDTVICKKCGLIKRTVRNE